jgi:chromosome segregation ATPase
LKKLGADRKKRLTDQGSAQAELGGLQSKHNAQRGDVERMTERASLLTRVQALEKCKPIVQYQFEKAKYEDMRDRQKEAEAELRELEAKVEPSLARLNSKTAYRDQLVACVQQRKKLVERVDSTCRNDAEKVNAHKQRMEDCDTEMATERDRNITTKKEMDRLKREVTHLKSTLENRPPELDTAALNEQIRVLSAQIRENSAKNREVDESIEEWKGDAQRMRGERDQLKQQMEQLKSQSGQQFSMLEKVSRETAQAWKWLKKNQSLFREKVYGPVIVECTITDQRYAAAVESMLNAGDFLSFTATNADDWRTLQEHLIGKMNLKDIHTRNAGKPMAHWTRPISREELTDCGLDGFAIDYLDGPEPVLSMLCDNKGLHKSAVSLQSGDEAQFERLKNSPIQSWVAGTRSYRIIRRREYGPNAVSTAVGSINNARYWTGQSIDHDAEAALNRKLREIESDLGVLGERKDELKEKKQELNEEHDDLLAKRVKQTLLRYFRISLTCSTEVCAERER